MCMTIDLRVEVGDRLFLVIMCDTFFLNYYNIPTFVWGDNSAADKELQYSKKCYILY